MTLSGASNYGNDENFVALMEQSFGASSSPEGKIVQGCIISIDADSVIVDVGLKSEGRIAKKEFDGQGDLKEGDIVSVCIEKIEGKNGETIVSRLAAVRRDAWDRLSHAHKNNNTIKGEVIQKVKGGYLVLLDGGVGAFLPGSQVGYRPSDIHQLSGPQDFKILKINTGNIVLSKKNVLQEQQDVNKKEALSNLVPGQKIVGIVKNITDYGAFIELLAGLDGLLHITDMAWRRVGHPSEMLKMGQELEVQVLSSDTERSRVSVGLKQLTADPWNGVLDKYKIGSVYLGVVTNIMDYGAFVELEPGVEGLVHESEVNWITNRHIPNGHIPNGHILPNAKINVMVLDADPARRRISLSKKRCEANPWEVFEDLYPVGSIITVPIKSCSSDSFTVELTDYCGYPINGVILHSNLSWSQSGEIAALGYKQDDTVTAMVLKIDVGQEEILLGVKQLLPNPLLKANLLDGSNVSAKVTVIGKDEIEVLVLPDELVVGIVKKSDLSREKQNQDMGNFKIGEQITAKVSSIDIDNNRVSLSIKAYEIEEYKKAVEKYGSADSGALLGDILGAAINKKLEE